MNVLGDRGARQKSVILDVSGRAGLTKKARRNKTRGPLQ